MVEGAPRWWEGQNSFGTLGALCHTVRPHQLVSAVLHMSVLAPERDGVWAASVPQKPFKLQRRVQTPLVVVTTILCLDFLNVIVI